ncbi:alpha amylase C-terminal domain-containing protein [Methylophaga lonarensis]
MRKAAEDYTITLLNFTPVVRKQYRIGVPEAGQYQVILNSDSEYYAGSNYPAAILIDAEHKPWSDRPFSLALDLPPLAGLVLVKSR